MDEILEIHNESEEELGDMASGRSTVSGPLDRIEEIWRRHINFVHLGFDDVLAKAPICFCITVQMKNVCQYCAKTSHKSAYICSQCKQLEGTGY